MISFELLGVPCAPYSLRIGPDLETSLFGKLIPSLAASSGRME